MKPGHIQVFDGLRVTTEHMNHLQGSFHSAIQDLREILGLGRVYHGFELVSEDDQSITVMPGLAFDFQGNRVISDEPKTVEVNFTEEGNNKYLCIKYEQIETGKVQERPTLIWDSCSVLIRDMLPEPEENLIPVAELVKPENGDTQFEIVSLLDTERDNVSETVEDDEGNGAADEEETEVETAAVPDLMEEELSSGEISGEEAEFLEEYEISGTEEETCLIKNNSENTGLKRTAGIRIQQGVVRLASDAGNAYDLKNILLDPLKRLLLSGEGSSENELLVTVAEKEITLDFQVISLSCNTILSAFFGPDKDMASSERGPTEDKPLLSINSKYQSTARGEATFSDYEVPQFGISMIQYLPNGQGGLPWQKNELTETAIAHLSFDTLSKAPDTGNVGNNSDIRDHLQLLVGVNKIKDKGFKTTCKLLWKGVINNETVGEIEKQKLYLMWDIAIAWKAIGKLSDQLNQRV